MSNLIKRYTDYKVKNEEIKARQRVERAAELQPYLEDIGREIVVERTDGHSILYISSLLALKNRNFIYEAVRAYQGTVPDEPTGPAKTFKTRTPARTTKSGQTPASEASVAAEGMFSWEFRNDSGIPEHAYYRVSIVGDEGYHSLPIAPDGSLELPYTWLIESVPARKTLYRQIIAEIEASRES